MGGITALLAIIAKHESDKIRSNAASLLTSVVSHNEKALVFAGKAGALNLYI